MGDLLQRRQQAPTCDRIRQPAPRLSPHEEEAAIFSAKNCSPQPDAPALLTKHLRKRKEGCRKCRRSRSCRLGLGEKENLDCERPCVKPVLVTNIRVQAPAKAQRSEPGPTARARVFSYIAEGHAVDSRLDSAPGSRRAAIQHILRQHLALAFRTMQFPARQPPSTYGRTKVGKARIWQS